MADNANDGGPRGPLVGLKVVEMAGIGPGPFCAMQLADMGAEVVRIDRMAPSGLGTPRDARYDLLNRGRRSLAVDLKNPDGVAAVARLIAQADILIDPFRPSVMERLGLGPDVCMQANPRLIYGRMTGWGQTGPLAQAAGHDINYIALSGVLHAIGKAGEPPVPPLNMIGDFGGGAMFLGYGILAALYERATSGAGQIVDAGMVDGAAYLMTGIYGMRAEGSWTDAREANVLDGAAHFYGTYATADDKHIAIGSIEAKFYALLLEAVGLDAADLPAQYDRAHWDELGTCLAAIIATKTRDQWCEIMEGTDICFAPVLSLDETPDHPHNLARANFITVAGVRQPAPAPRFSRTDGAVQGPPPLAGQHSEAALSDWGFEAGEIAALATAGAIGTEG